MCSFRIRKERSKSFDGHELGDQRLDDVEELRVKITFDKNILKLRCFTPVRKGPVQTCSRMGAMLHVGKDVGTEELLLQRVGQQKAIGEREYELEVLSTFSDGEQQGEELDRHEQSSDLNIPEIITQGRQESAKWWENMW
jgi:hypothetical protein